MNKKPRDSVVRLRVWRYRHRTEGQTGRALPSKMTEEEVAAMLDKEYGAENWMRTTLQDGGVQPMKKSQASYFRNR